MRHFKADADLLRILQEYLLVRDYDKASRIIRVIIDVVCQHLKPLHLGRICAAHGGLAFVLFFPNLPGCNRRICHADLLPLTMLVQ